MQGNVIMRRILNITLISVFSITLLSSADIAKAVQSRTEVGVQSAAENKRNTKNEQKHRTSQKSGSEKNAASPTSSEKNPPKPPVTLRHATTQERWRPSRLTLRDRRNRWRVLDANGLPVPRPFIFDPYNQNPLKGDFPVLGQNTFMVLTAVANTASNFLSQEDQDIQANSNFVSALEFFHGSTVFKPKDWSVKASANAKLDFIDANQNKNIDLLELFGEIKLFDVGRNFDFTSFRGGVQGFASDFDGFIFKDVNLGAQLFGELRQNQHQWSLAYFDRLDKSEAASNFDLLGQKVYIANFFWEDLFKPGFKTVFSFLYNRDRSVDGNNLDIYYVGFASAGNWGRLEFNPTFNYAFGTEQFNPISESENTVSAFLAGLELEYPKNNWNYRSAAFLASGDTNPNDGLATGFDSINDNIALFGAGNSFVVGKGNFFTRGNSFLPANRTQGISNFVNPGMLLLNLGLDMVATPKLFLQMDYNNFNFLNTASLENVQSRAVGNEIVAALNYRVFLNENFIFQLGGSAFFPGAGGEEVLGNSDTIYTVNIALVTVF